MSPIRARRATSDTTRDAPAHQPDDDGGAAGHPHPGTIADDAELEHFRRILAEGGLDPGDTLDFARTRWSTIRALAPRFGGVRDGQGDPETVEIAAVEPAEEADTYASGEEIRDAQKPDPHIRVASRSQAPVERLVPPENSDPCG